MAGPMMLPLPNEMILEIGGQLSDGLLLSFCLASRKLLHLLRPVLYRHPDLRTPKSLRCLDASLSRDIKLRDLIFGLVFGEDLFMGYDSVDRELELFDVAERVISRCKNLIDIKLENYRILVEFEPCWTAIQSRNLTQLDFYYECGISLSELLNALPNLKSLGISQHADHDTMDMNINDEGMEPGTNNSLLSLKLDDIPLCMEEILWFFRRCPHLLSFEMALNEDAKVFDLELEEVESTFRTAPSSLIYLAIECSSYPFVPPIVEKGFLSAAFAGVPTVVNFRTDDAFCNWDFLEKCGHQLECLGLYLYGRMDDVNDESFYGRGVEFVLSSLIQRERFFPRLKTLEFWNWREVRSPQSRSSLDILCKSTEVFVRWRED